MAEPWWSKIQNYVPTQYTNGQLLALNPNAYQPRRNSNPPRDLLKGANSRARAPLFVHLPNMGIALQTRYVQRHLPDLWTQMQQSGNRVVHPLDTFQNGFTNANQPLVYEVAAEWICT